MCSCKAVELSGSMYRRARQFYITRPWGMNIDPLTLASLFEKVIDDPAKAQPVKIGSRVTVFDYQEDQVCQLQIVAPQDSAPEAGKISFLSPLGAALMDAKPDDKISVSVLGRQMHFLLVKVTDKTPGGETLA